MARLKAVNQKARRVDEQTLAPQDVVGLQGGGAPMGPNIPLGCSFVFSPGWEDRKSTRLNSSHG